MCTPLWECKHSVECLCNRAFIHGGEVLALELRGLFSISFKSTFNSLNIFGFLLVHDAIDGLAKGYKFECLCRREVCLLCLLGLEGLSGVCDLYFMCILGAGRDGVNIGALGLSWGVFKLVRVEF